MELVKPGIYRHYKGNCYLVIGVFVHTETGEQYVAYVGGLRFWVRPLNNFLSEVERESRSRFTFEKSVTGGKIGQVILDNGKL